MTTIQFVSAAIFAIALVHTFSTKIFEKLAHRQPDHAGVWHLLGEVEIVFGVWAMVLIVALALASTPGESIAYLDSCNFTEPMFVFAIMVIAGTRAILQWARLAVVAIAGLVPLPGAIGFAFVTLAAVPLLGSFITEPAAMTLAALMLRDRIFSAGGVSQRLKYAMIGVLFVNVSIGGTLTSFAAPPVLMVASVWNWDTPYMLANFGWKAAIAVLVNALGVTLLFRSELARLPGRVEQVGASVPVWVGLVHVLLLAGVVVFAHHPAAFMGLLLLFMGLATAYPQHQDRLILREGLLVAFFLAGLVVLGGQQQWWLEPLLAGMDETTVYFGATALTAITDNAALTYLGAQVEGLSEPFKQALVAGAVTGGGLTVIANAPNPAGFAILRGHFEDGAISPLGLFAAALPATVVAILAFRLL
ncbi:MAG TPA: putative Na+/H+ antiporter [Burkholderiaceae bacterium]|nr:putative Na+/H+ antiporter [Burkholderiaceae bacterium]